MAEDQVQVRIIAYLKEIGYGRNLVSKTGKEHGVDIRVRNNKVGRYFLVECKGDGGRSHLHNHFYISLGQIISRMHTDRSAKDEFGYKYGIAAPNSWRKKVIKHLPYYVCKKLNLHVFLVGSDEEVEYLSWKELKALQLS